jgi:hypothetical protein
VSEHEEMTVFGKRRLGYVIDVGTYQRSRDLLASSHHLHEFLAPEIMIRYPKSTLLSVLLSMVPERRLEAQILGRVINSRLNCGDIGIVHFKFTKSISNFHLS